MNRPTVAFFLILAAAFITAAQTSTFTYQGKLTEGSLPANGTYEMRFTLHGSASAGLAGKPGAPIILGTTPIPVTVTNGIFTVNLDFNVDAFTGEDRWIEIEVRKPPETSFTTLTPRQQITSSPYSIKALSAGSSDSLSAACVGCVDDAKINDVAGSKVTGTVANATNAVNVTGVVPIANGGTGSSTKNFVDTTTTQVVTGTKTFTGLDWGTSRPSGLFGQPVATALSTAGVVPVAGGGFVAIPGLSVTITVPTVCLTGSTQCIAYISADGGMQTNSNLAAGVSRSDVALHIDGTLVPAGGYKRLVAANTSTSTGTIVNWALGYTAALSVGTHTIAIMAAHSSGDPATVGGNSASVLQGRLTVVIIRQ